jgi:hypothetical protein
VAEPDPGIAGFLYASSDPTTESMADTFGRDNLALRNFFAPVTTGVRSVPENLPASALDLLRPKGDENVLIWGSDPWSNLPKFLRALAVLARERARNPRKVLAQPRSQKAKCHHFQMQLSRYFMRAYGQPLHKQVAQISSAVFSTNIDERTVRKLVKYRSKQRTPDKTVR